MNELTNRKPLRPPCRRYREIFTRVEIEGMPRDQVAKEFGIQQRSVTCILSRVRQWMRQNGATWESIDPNVVRGHLMTELYLARLEHQWKELMAEWHKSKNPAESQIGIFDPNGKLAKAEVTRTTRCGDIRYLMEAAALIERIGTIRITLAQRLRTYGTQTVEQRFAHFKLILGEAEEELRARAA